MTGDKHFDTILLAWIGLAFLIFGFLTRITAPYGRHVKKTWGPLMDHRLGWIIMELASPLSFAFFFLTGNQEKSTILWLFFYLWIFHYFNRSIVYPLKAQIDGREMPILIMGSSLIFNFVNGYLNGYYLGHLAPAYQSTWLLDMRFITGAFLFIAGMLINYVADKTLIELREKGEYEYSIPQGGFYQYITCPNYFGEIIEWTGFALMTWSLASFAFALWTTANLLPRAGAHHAWYLEHFSDYPQDRKAVIPFLW
jgi:protein-S-isoprenylcysteine O-methyltransferase Ste14